MARILIPLALLLAAGCGKKGADCAVVADKAISLIRVELEREEAGEERQRRESMLPALKEELIAQCETEKWSPAVRRCILAAESTAELEPCDPDGEGEAAEGEGSEAGEGGSEAGEAEGEGSEAGEGEGSDGEPPPAGE